MNFQTPPHIAKYMASMIPINSRTFLEPSPGAGNLVTAIRQRAEQFAGAMIQISAPTNFFYHPIGHYDCIVMNPPFSDKDGFGIPPELELKGMKLGYYFLNECLKRSDHVIALMPVFVITDSDVRNRQFYKFGLKSITLLPRKTFEYSRIQTCILEFEKGWNGLAFFKFYEEYYP
jgi:type I restriction-modification system DNA methylase subunit